MTGILSWIAFGAIAGIVTSRMMSGRDRGLALFTIAIGVAGALVGGFAGVVFGVGSVSTFGFYGLLFAGIGSALTLVSYRKLMAV